MFLIAVKVKDTLDKMLIEHSWVANQQQMDQTELRETFQLLVHKGTHKPKKQGTFPLHIVFLDQVSQEGECLFSNQQTLVTETRGDVWDVGINFGGVSDGEVAEDNDNIVPDCYFV